MIYIKIPWSWFIKNGKTDTTEYDVITVFYFDNFVNKLVLLDFPRTWRRLCQM